MSVKVHKHQIKSIPGRYFVFYFMETMGAFRELSYDLRFTAIDHFKGHMKNRL